MNTDGTPQNREPLLHRELTGSIIGAAMEVLNGLGHGYHEKPYENALCIEPNLRGLRFTQQASYPLRYKNEMVGEFIPDLIVEDAVVVDTKVIDVITDHERGQMINYLRITGLRVGLIINFRHARLEWERIVL
jgi:GxxExxY protein